MIEHIEPDDWKSLQKGVCRLFNEIGLSADTEVKLVTPRGKVVVDVYAIDEHSIDKIKYLVECKNWSAAIPKSVVHSFTTVMHETGANIGFIVSKYGLQSGAEDYTQNTNIIGLTYQELQERYFSIWWRKYFRSRLGAAADSALQYIEPINSFRERVIDKLSQDKVDKIRNLQKKYYSFIMAIITGRGETDSQINNIEMYKKTLGESLGELNYFKAANYRDLLWEAAEKSLSIEEEFNEIFGSNIFSRET